MLRSPDAPLASARADCVELEAGSRLHFGLLSFGQSGVRPFGGVGVMVDRPTLRLRVESADRFETVGPAVARVMEFAERLRTAWNIPQLPACRLEVVEAPPAHVGFGTGTQLALAVAAAVGRWMGRDMPAADILASWVGRGERSAIGSWGFQLGGLLIEGGHEPAPGRSTVSPLLSRLSLPETWRWVLITPHRTQGLSGAPERAAFARLPAVSPAVTEQLCDELWNELLPAAELGDFERFSASLYRYGHAAGNCFAAIQGGPFANAAVAELVEQVRSLGVAGVGQSSWGPTIFALGPNESAARDLAAVISRLPSAASADVQIASTRNHGATILRRASDVSPGS